VAGKGEWEKGRTKGTREKEKGKGKGKGKKKRERERANWGLKVRTIRKKMKKKKKKRKKKKLNWKRQSMEQEPGFQTGGCRIVRKFHKWFHNFLRQCPPLWHFFFFFFLQPSSPAEFAFLRSEGCRLNYIFIYVAMIEDW
jgi:hypothetical protein